MKPVVPTVRVNLTHAVKIPPLCQAMVPVKAHPPSGAGWKTPLYLEASDCSPCYCEDALLQPNGSGHTYMNVSNPTTLLQDLEKGTCVGIAASVSEVDMTEERLADVSNENSDADEKTADVWRIEENQSAKWRIDRYLNSLLTLALWAVSREDSCNNC